MFKTCRLGGQWIDTHNGHSFSDHINFKFSLVINRHGRVELR